MTATVFDRLVHLQLRNNTLESRAGWRRNQVERLRARLANAHQQLRDEHARHHAAEHQLRDDLIAARCDIRQLQRDLGRARARTAQLTEQLAALTAPAEVEEQPAGPHPICYVPARRHP